MRFTPWMLVALAAASAGGLAVFHVNRRRGARDALALAMLPVFGTLLGLNLAQKVILAPFYQYNEVRLASAAGLARGQGLYAGPSRGSVQSMMYTPLSAIGYLPAALAAEPDAAIKLGAALSALYYFLPALVFFRRLARVPGGGPAGWVLPLYGLVGLAAISSADPWGLDFSAYYIHADAPALGLAMAACAAMVPGARAGSPGFAGVLTAVALGWLAVWSKQVMLPALAAVHLWALLAYGPRAFLRFCAAGAAVGALSLAAFAGAFGWRELYLNALQLPGSFPMRVASYPFTPGRLSWAGGFPCNVAMTAMDLATKGAFFAIALAARVLDRSESTAAVAGPRPAARWAAGNPWALPVLVALACFPLSVLGHVKWGGGPNSESPTLYFLAAGFLGLIIREHAEARARGGPGAASPAAHAGLIALAATAVKVAWQSEAKLYDFNALLLSALVTAALAHLIGRPRRAGVRLAGPLLAAATLAAAWPLAAGVFRGANDLDNGLAWRRDHNYPRTAFRYIRAHPGRAYFPNNPLAHILAEGRSYHFLPAVNERNLAGLTVGPRHLSAHLPPDFEFYAVPRDGDHFGTDPGAFLPAHREPLAVPFLAEFDCIRRPDLAATRRPGAVLSR